MKAVALLVMRKTHKLRHVAVGYEEGWIIDVFQELVAILHHHQLVATVQLLLAVKNCRADASIVAVGPFVGTAQHNHLVQPVAVYGV